jgi:hypothetical protein
MNIQTQQKIHNSLYKQFNSKQALQILSLIRHARHLSDKQIKDILLKNSILLSVKNIKNYAGIEEKIIEIKKNKGYIKDNINNSIIDIKI